MKKISKFIYLFLTIVLIAGILPGAVIAWATAQSAQSECSSRNTVLIKVSFTNKEKTRAMNVEAKDEQTGKNTNLGAIEGGQTKTGDIDTNIDSIMDGVVIFYLTWTDGGSGSDKRSAQYKSVSCAKPSPTPAVTPTPTTTPRETPTPTISPTPTIIPTSTPIPTITLTPTPTNVPVATTINNNNTNNNIVYVQAQPTSAPQVLAAVEMKSLPETGGNPLSLLGLLSLFPVGIYLRKTSISS